MAGCLSIVMMIVVFWVAYKLDLDMGGIFVLLMMIVGGILGVGKLTKDKYDDKKREYCELNEIPNDIREIQELNKGNLYTWRDTEKLFFIDSYNGEIMKDVLKKDKFSIDVGSIIHYRREGDAYSITKGGGTSVGGAIAGGVIAGGAGAVVGGRKEVESEFIDKRNTILIYEEYGKIQSRRYSSNSYDTFLDLIPEKHIDVVSMRNDDRIETL